MGNIQQYCGDQCMSKDQLMPGSERIFPKPKYVLNDQQEYSLRKVISAWRHYKSHKHDPYSFHKLKKMLEKLDEYISEEKGTFISKEEFESIMHPAILKQYERLAKIESIYGFQSLNRFNGKNNFNINNNSNNNINTNLNNVNTYNTYNNNYTGVYANTADLKTEENLLFLRKPVKLRDTGEIYFGFWNLKGEMEGYGIFVNVEGQVSEGLWLARGHCTQARLFFKNGTYFQGSFIQNLPNGKGSLFLSETEPIYEGEWLNSEFDGIGKLYLSKFCIYEGQFRNSSITGKGKLIYEGEDGQYYNYNGEFLNNKFHGFGNIQFFKTKAEHAEEYTGTWVNGVPSGKGTYVWKTGNRYEGNYEAGKKKGQGKYIFNSGKNYYEGSWSNGKPNGKGILVIENISANKTNNNSQIKISGMWKIGKAQKIDSEEEFKKINNDESKLNIPVENEIFSTDFLLEIHYVTTLKNNIESSYYNQNIGKIQYQQVMTTGFYKGLYKALDKQNVFSNNNANNNIINNDNKKNLSNNNLQNGKQ